MKRLLCIVSSLDTGGAETFMMKIFRCLPDNYKIDYIVSTNSGYYEEEVLQLGGKIYRIPLRTKHPLKTFLDIKRIVKENEYKYVLKLCDTPKGYFDLLASKMGGANKLCVRSCNASSSESLIKNICNNIIRPAFNKIANVKIAPSDLAAQYTFGKKEVESGAIYFLNNAVDLNKYRYYENGREHIRKEFHLENSIVVGHIGRFNKQKNHEYLINVFEQIKKQIKNAKLLLVGNGELKNKIISLVQEKNLQDDVIFAGIRSDIPEILSAMDVFVFPSFYEGMPNTVIEAQATGLPCLISDSITKEAAITELVEYMAIDSAPDKWAIKVEDLLKIKRKDTKEEIISANYDMETIVKEFIRIIYS